MKLSLIIAALRLRCPVFESRVSGAAEFKPLPDTAKMKLPAAYVIPLDDNAEDNKSQTDYWQNITDGFAVIVIIDNQSDERGQKSSHDAVHDIRNELWKALLGWQVDDCYDPIQYDGGNLLDMNRSMLYYQFEFSARREISAEETRQWDDLQQLKEFSEVLGGIDLIVHEDQQPDGHIDFPLQILLNE
ncbi:hypothetical protein EKN56_19675 [Limnobaculum zhutongyuii]|uniref:Uncharacterized protein n=1 Tax=Limnobaculum zhutongyuii TaxID=2498113 RepID=A0A411WQ83_9GAMM|nr:hypothetical protein [Limnobaculum zhutongyuii]QBH98414.1 hypothetical protein EKN56_19675 [Limnobaculum zhutongyuii]TQS89688.1 hypothetical protein ELQ32_04565 [Limnobaculum zhutongyuii]